MVVYVVPNDLTWNRLGISVSKRAGNAVVRAAVRRRVREAFRTAKDRIPNGYDIICVARPLLKDRLSEISHLFMDVVQIAVRRGIRRRGG